MTRQYWLKLRPSRSGWLITDKGWIERPEASRQSLRDARHQDRAASSVQAGTSDLFVKVSQDVWSKVKLEGAVFEYVLEFEDVQQIL